MKKVFLFTILLMGLITGSSIFASDNYVSKETHKEKCHHVEAPYGKCRSCGGQLSWTAKAKQESKTCPSCNGRGKLGSGKYEQKCNTCKGSGKIWVWKSGNVCQSCHAVYLD